MSNKDIGDIYKSMLKGDSYTPSPKMDSLYESVYTEARQATGVDAQGRVYDIDGQPRDPEKTVLVQDEQGMWKMFRLAKGLRLDLIDELEGMEDKSDLIDQIKTQAKSASIIEHVGMSSFRDVIVNLRDFIIDSAKLTKKMQNSQESVPIIAKNIMHSISDFEFQQQLVNFMNLTAKQKEFNLFDIIGDVKGNVHGVHFDIANNPHMRYMMPAGEDVKARGAAGPGEALLSFIYNGNKPKGAGDILLGRKSVIKDEQTGEAEMEDWTIELKYNQGRIGKSITPAKIKLFPKLFTADVPTYHQEMGVRFAGVNDANSKSNPVYVFPQEATGDNVYATRNQTIESITNYNTEVAANAKKETQPGVQEANPPEKNEILKAMEAVEALKTGKNGAIAPIIGRRDEFKLKKTEGSPGYEEGFGVLSDQRVRAMTLDQFVEQYTGIEKGDKKDIPFNLYGDNTIIMPGETIDNILKQLDGVHDKHRLENLVGSIHIKNYLTHIEPFTWLVVYDQYGSARSIRHDEIVSLDVISLIDIVNTNGLKFGPRTDGGGYDLRFL